jgi:ubiquinone/menaquinone biosynthesis C-methylase UbiE
MELTRIPGWHILALDRSPVCISTAANHMQKHGSDLQKQQAKFRRGDLSRLLLNSASVDVVVAFHVLDQVKDLPRVLKEVRFMGAILFSGHAAMADAVGASR